MAGFLDNSGDIILDAVITDVGRQRLSQGNFSIEKFALGDDEIQYNLYNKNHPSGSAYYDLEILQSPVFQGMTQANANINYGLLTLTNTELLYLPTIVNNQKKDSLSAGGLQLSGSGLCVVCVNGQTYTTVTTPNADSTYSSSPNTYTTADDRNAKGIVLESGLNTTDVRGTEANQIQLLHNHGLMDSSFAVYCDSRFFTSVLGPAASNNAFANNTQGSTITWGPRVFVTSQTSTLQLANYNTFYIAGVVDKVYYRAGNQVVDTAISALAGPRGYATFLNFGVDASLSNLSGTGKDDKWTKYGSSISIGGVTYDYVDTMVYVVGEASSATIQLSVRLLRLP